MVAALMLALSMPAYPPPVAAFAAPAVVRVGAQVHYVDTSYDPAPGHSIVLQIWTGRSSVFYATGSHTVSLTIEDDRGLWGQTSRTILVVPPVTPPPPPQPSIGAVLSAAPSSAYRGDPVDLTLTAPANAQSIALDLPGPFTAPVALPTGMIDYPSINAGQWTFRNGKWRTRIWIPWTASSPANGTYTLLVRFRLNGHSFSSETSLRIDGTDRLAMWRLP